MALRQALVRKDRPTAVESSAAAAEGESRFTLGAVLVVLAPIAGLLWAMIGFFVYRLVT